MALEMSATVGSTAKSVHKIKKASSVIEIFHGTHGGGGTGRAEDGREANTIDMFGSRLVSNLVAIEHSVTPLIYREWIKNQFLVIIHNFNFDPAPLVIELLIRASNIENHSIKGYRRWSGDSPGYVLNIGLKYVHCEVAKYLRNRGSSII